MTIGVIDECRKMGLGTKLLNATIETVEKKFPACITIWLHVIEYNKSAIQFYVKNKFTKFRRMKKHYYIDFNDYDAVLLYRGIGRLRSLIPRAASAADPEA